MNTAECSIIMLIIIIIIIIDVGTVANFFFLNNVLSWSSNFTLQKYTNKEEEEALKIKFKIRHGSAPPAVEPHVFTNSCQKNDTFGSKQYITSLKNKILWAVLSFFFFGFSFLPSKKWNQN